MYRNIGGKIKGVSRMVEFVGVVISLTIFAVIWYLMSEADRATAGFFVGLLAGIIEFLLVWVSTLLLYGFGQLVENSDRLVEINGRCSENVNSSTCVKKKKSDAAVQDSAADAPYWCQVCDFPGPFGDTCPKCGSDIKVYPRKE